MLSTLHYIEAFDHTELIYRWAPVWEAIGDLKVCCHLGKLQRKQLEAADATSSIAFLSPDDGESWARYVDRLELDPTKDIVVVGTLGRRPEWFKTLATRQGLRYWIVLHNLNYCLGKPSVARALSSWKAFRSHVRDLANTSAKQVLLDGATGWLVPTKSMKTSADKLSHRDKTRVLPFACMPTAKTNEPESAEHMVGVPGTVTEKVRDYGLVEAFVRKHRVSSGICILFLFGKVVDRKVVASLQSIIAKREDWEMIVCGEVESMNKYGQMLESCNFLLAPVRRTSWYGSFREIVGRTKMTGVYFDAVASGRRLYAPRWLAEDCPYAIPLDELDINDGRSTSSAIPQTPPSQEELADLWRSALGLKETPC